MSFRYLRETKLTGPDPCISGVAGWSRSLARLENGSSGIRLQACFSSLTVSISAGRGISAYPEQAPSGLSRGLASCHFTRVGTSIHRQAIGLKVESHRHMPRLLVRLISALPFTANRVSLLLRHPGHPHPSILGMLASDQRLPLLGSVPPGNHLWPFLRGILPARTRTSCSCGEATNSKSARSTLQASLTGVGWRCIQFCPVFPCVGSIFRADLGRGRLPDFHPCWRFQHAYPGEEPKDDGVRGLKDSVGSVVCGVWCGTSRIAVRSEMKE